jgi:membrane protein implicated in regulation of membrane protease activity
VIRVFAAKAWLGGTALAVGLTGIALERRWLVWVAVTLLAAAFALRFAAPRGDEGTDRP